MELKNLRRALTKLTSSPARTPEWEKWMKKVVLSHDELAFLCQRFKGRHVVKEEQLPGVIVL